MPSTRPDHSLSSAISAERLAGITLWQVLALGATAAAFTTDPLRVITRLQRRPPWLRPDVHVLAVPRLDDWWDTMDLPCPELTAAYRVRRGEFFPLDALRAKGIFCRDPIQSRDTLLRDLIGIACGLGADDLAALLALAARRRAA